MLVCVHRALGSGIAHTWEVGFLGAVVEVQWFAPMGVAPLTGAVMPWFRGNYPREQPLR